MKRLLMMVVATGAMLFAGASESNADHRHYSNRGGYSISFSYGSGYGYGNGVNFGYNRGNFGPWDGGFRGHRGYHRPPVYVVPGYPSFGPGYYGGGYYGGGFGGHRHCR